MTDHLDIETHDYSRITGGNEAYDFGPQILHLAILLILHTLFHRFWTIMTQANLQIFIDITVTGDLAMEPLDCSGRVTESMCVVRIQAPDCTFQIATSK